MSNNSPTGISTKTSQGKPAGGPYRLLRTVALIALAVGAMGSLVLMFREGQRTSRFLLILFTIWVLSPFVALLGANTLSKRWSLPTRVTPHCVMLLVALGSLAIYGEWVDVKPTGSANAFLFVAVPPVSLLLITIIVSMAAWLSNRPLRRRDDK